MIYHNSGDIVILEAEPGFLITNGEVYGKKVYLSPLDNQDNWYETEDI